MRCIKHISVLVFTLTIGGVFYFLLTRSALSGIGQKNRSSPLRVVLFSQKPSSRDLGDVAPGERVEIPFVLVNEGTAAVRSARPTYEPRLLGPAVRKF